MKHMRIIPRRRFLTTSLLGGLSAALLQPERVEAAPLQAFGPQVKITRLDVNSGAIPSVPITPTRIFEASAFYLANSASTLEVTFQGYVSVFTVPSGSAAFFELRVDDLPPSIPESGKFTFLNYNQGQVEYRTFSGYWNAADLPSYPYHFPSIYVWASAASTVQNAAIFGVDGDSFIVKEYLPFGATYIPVVQR